MHTQHAKILLLYASSYGQTKKVALRLASGWRALGHEVDLLPMTSTAPAPQGYDAVVIGSRLAITYAHSVKRYAEKHHAALTAGESAFFSVSMTQASSDPAAHATVDALIRHFLEATGWSPKHAVSFAGALPYTKYDPMTRLVMKLISARTGQTTDTSRDHEFTDWGQVDAFAGTVAAALQARTARVVEGVDSLRSSGESTARRPAAHAQN